jgi:molybdenum cofactor cytidylyltransferase
VPGGVKVPPADTIRREEAAGVIGAVILAGGSSSRLGRPKQLLDLEGKPLLQHAVDAAADAGLPEIVVVLGHRAPEIGGAITLPPGARVVVNPDHARGQSTSLATGLRSLGADVEAAVVLLGDQPRVRPALVRSMADGFAGDGEPVLRAVYRGRPGHPVLLARSVWDLVAAEEGDRGARGLMAARPELVRDVEVDEDPPLDVDTWEDYLAIGGTP